MTVMKKKLNKTTKSNLITYAMVVIVYIIVQLLVSGGAVSSLMKGLLVPLCVYSILAVSLNALYFLKYVLALIRSIFDLYRLKYNKVLFDLL